MEFIYADELKKRFSVFGHFYDLNINEKIFNCRSILEITSNEITDIKSSEPCAVVVMMNPGSSKPLDINYSPKVFLPDEIMTDSWNKEMIPAKPDNAQYQIMRIMLLQGWKHVRILNLSDLRNGNSGDFSIEYKEAKNLDSSIPHSLLHEKRHPELIKNCSTSRVIIAAWGSTEVLREAAISFLDVIKDVEGLELDKPWFRYPSPYKKVEKIDWLKTMNNKLEHNKALERNSLP